MIELKNVSKSFRRESDNQIYRALTDVSLTVQEGEFLCLLGPSGCGKSTLLNMIAGFDHATSGDVLMRGEKITAPDAERGMVFQSEIAVLPWLTVEENVAYGPQVRGVSRAQVKEITDANLERVGLGAHRTKYPRELSGGMKQRVQIARILANDPTCLLMDEPFGALDAQTRTNLQHELELIWSRDRKTAVFVTHDISEAIWLGDRIAVMSRGPHSNIHSIHTNPQARPRDRMDADFIDLYNTLSAEMAELSA
ncbi:MAG: ABC transporter ATP-binding protein [Salinibacterium amurskyense]